MKRFMWPMRFLVIMAVLALPALVQNAWPKIEQRFLDSALPPPTSSQKKEEPQTGDPAKKIVSAIDLFYEQRPLQVVVYKIKRNSAISLIPNFTQKINAEKLVEDNGCAAAINGGFYQKNQKPLGLFWTQGKSLGEKIDSNVATGYFWQDADGSLHMGRSAPQKDASIFIVQTGPIFDLANEQSVSIVDDEHARRSAIGKDGAGNFFLLTFYDPENLFSGPLLADLPSLAKRGELGKIANLTTLLNLDGGSASFFYTKTGKHILSELVPVGSILCIKE